MSGITNARHEDFTAVLNLPASPATVSALFTSAAGVSRWWGPTEGDGTVGGTLATALTITVTLALFVRPLLSVADKLKV